MTHDEPCPTCLGLVVRLRWQELPDRRRQIRAVCVKCGRFRLWVPQTPQTVAEADAAEPPDRQPGLFD